MIELLRQRKSIRSYTPQPIEDEKIELLKETVLLSPSSRRINPWEFIFVTETELIQKLAQAKQHGSAFLKEAALAVVVVGDQTKSDVWVEDCSIASTLLQLTAQSLGLGSCWVQIRLRYHDASTTSEKYVQKLLNIPEPFCVESIIGIGYPSEHAVALPIKTLEYHKIHLNFFGKG